MKTTKKKILLVALMFGTLIGYAKENVNSNDLTNKKTVKVEFKNVKKGQTLTIKSENGLTIYTREIKSNGTFSRLFDFTALDNGNYNAELNKDYEIIVKAFTVKNGVVTFLDNKSKKVFKPVIRTKGDILFVSKVTFNNKPLKVTIYYKSEMILSETLKGNDILKRIYKLSETEKGEYKVIISSDDRTYAKNFTI